MAILLFLWNLIKNNYPFRIVFFVMRCYCQSRWFTRPIHQILMVIFSYIKFKILMAGKHDTLNIICCKLSNNCLHRYFWFLEYFLLLNSILEYKLYYFLTDLKLWLWHDKLSDFVTHNFPMQSNKPAQYWQIWHRFT